MFHLHLIEGLALFSVKLLGSKCNVKKLVFLLMEKLCVSRISAC